MTVRAEGRRLLRLEVRNAETPIERKPPWIKTRATMGPQYRQLKDLVRGQGLHTVCEEAGCPNIFECWEDREATFLIGGEQCTRRCDFCQIDTGKPAELDRDEPNRGEMTGPADTSCGLSGPCVSSQVICRGSALRQELIDLDSLVNEIDRADGVWHGRPQSTRGLTSALGISYFPYFVCKVAAHGPK